MYKYFFSYTYTALNGSFGYGSLWLTIDEPFHVGTTKTRIEEYLQESVESEIGVRLQGPVTILFFQEVPKE